DSAGCGYACGAGDAEGLRYAAASYDINAGSGGVVGHGGNGGSINRKLAYPAECPEQGERLGCHLSLDPIGRRVVAYSGRCGGVGRHGYELSSPVVDEPVRPRVEASGLQVGGSRGSGRIVAGGRGAVARDSARSAYGRAGGGGVRHRSHGGGVGSRLRGLTRVISPADVHCKTQCSEYKCEI